MEKIKINEIIKKESGLVIVKYNDNKEATMNTKWQEQEVDYIEKDVGIGGSVSVTIQTKGQYTNITKVDMNSGEKGNVSVANPQEVHTGSSLMSQKEIGMCAGGLMKCYAEIGAACITAQAEFNAEGVIQDLLDAYHKFVKSLEDNG